MRVLLDTHLLLWAAGSPQRLPKAALSILKARDTTPIFSAASIWEVVIKNGLGRRDFSVDPVRLREQALHAGFGELPVRAPHVLEVGALPSLHSDPFDRILLAQARIEQMVLLTNDQKLLEYGSPAQGV